jgi:hypothetical protein
MNEIRINPTVLLLLILGAMVAVVATQMPEIRRYLNVRAM